MMGRITDVIIVKIISTMTDNEQTQRSSCQGRITDVIVVEIISMMKSQEDNIENYPPKSTLGLKHDWQD